MYRVLSSKGTEMILQVAGEQENERMPRKQRISFETEVGQFKEGKEKQVHRYKDKWVGRVSKHVFSPLWSLGDILSRPQGHPPGF